MSSCRSVVVVAMLVGALSSCNRSGPPERIEHSSTARTTAMADTSWPESLDAIVAAPQHHRILLENEAVRVLDVTVLPGVKQPLHSHRWPSVLYVTSGTAYRDFDASGAVVFDTKDHPSPAFPVVEWMGPQAPHAVENYGTDAIRLVRVELKQQAPPDSQ